MQIHELTQPKLVEALGAGGSFLSGLTAGMSDRYMDKTPGAGKEQDTSEDWQTKYKNIQNDPAVNTYVSSLADSWAKNSAAVGTPTQGLASGTTLQNMVPSLVTAAAKLNNQLTSTQIGQLLAKSAPTIWKNTKDKPAAITQLAAELTKKGVTVDAATTTQGAVSSAPVATNKVRAKYPKAPALGAVAEPPVYVGGKKLDPKYPGDANTLAALKQHGKLNETALIGPAADQYKASFIKWSDGQLATKVQETGTTVTMHNVRAKFPDLAKELTQALNQIVATKGTPQQAQAVTAYAKFAVAGVQALAQIQKNKISLTDRQYNKQDAAATGSIKQSLAQAGVDPTRLSQLGAQQPVRRTGNPAADSLLKLSGFKL